MTIILERLCISPTEAIRQEINHICNKFCASVVRRSAISVSGAQFIDVWSRPEGSAIAAGVAEGELEIVWITHSTPEISAIVS